MAQSLYCMADNKIWLPKIGEGPKPLYQKIVDAMAEDIANGRLTVGDKLPPQRQIAWKLGINLSTITKAFQQAAKQHLIAGAVGRGTYILGQSTEAELFLLRQSSPDKEIDLSTHIPVAYPDDHQLEQSIEKLSTQSDGLAGFLDYQGPEKLAQYKLSAAKWLQTLGLNIPANQCVVTNTAQNALLVVLLASCKADDLVLVNEYTFPGLKALAKQLSIKLYPIQSDQFGILPSALDLAIRSTGATSAVSGSSAVSSPFTLKI